MVYNMAALLYTWLKTNLQKVLLCDGLMINLIINTANELTVGLTLLLNIPDTTWQIRAYIILLAKCRSVSLNS